MHLLQQADTTAVAGGGLINDLSAAINLLLLSTEGINWLGGAMQSTGFGPFGTSTGDPRLDAFAGGNLGA